MKYIVENSRLRNVLLLVYVLVVLGISASVRAETSNSNPHARSNVIQVETLVGEMVSDDSGKLFLVTHDDISHELKSQASLRLANWVGEEVQVTGYELKHSVGPFQPNRTSSPLLDAPNDEMTPASVLVVLDIREPAELSE